MQSFISKKNSGFSAVELSILISALASLAIIYLASTTNPVINNALKLEITKKRIAKVEQAIIGFVSTNKRLPCPCTVCCTCGLYL